MKDLYALFRQSVAGLRLLVVATVICGFAYPLVVYGFGAVAAPWQANGSLVTATGAHTTDPSKAVGSAIIGQVVKSDKLFFDRPSAAGNGYDMTDTYGSNYGPENPDLIKAIQQRKVEIAQREGVDPSQVPPDAVTASASGLDPDISVAYAELQVVRVARANGLSVADVGTLVDQNTHGRTWGVLGEAHVNVLMLNIAVERAAGAA
jgi:K+-transporting ATPase ATPase C chain